MKKFTQFALLGIIFQLLTINTLSQWIEWEKRIMYSHYTAGYCIKKVSDGNYVIAGERSTGGLVLKINQNGDTLWNNSTNCIGFSFAEDNSGKIYSIYLDNFTKLDQNGNRIWYKYLTEPGYDQVKLFDIIKTSDNKLVSVGAIEGPTFNHAYICKFDTNGSLLWSKINQSQTNNNGFNSVKQLSDGSFILTGSARVNNSYFLYLVKKDVNGNTIWEKLLGENNGYLKSGKCIFQTFDNGYLIFGSITYSTGNSAFTITKTDSLGNLLWNKKHGDTMTVNSIIYAESVIKDNITNQYITPMIFSNNRIPDTTGCILTGFDSLGNKIWERSVFDDTLVCYGYSVVSCNDSSYIVCGISFGTLVPDKLDSPHYLYLLKSKKINPIGISNISSEIPNRFILNQNYPNPFNPNTKIKFELPKTSDIEFNVYDILGRKIYSAYYNNKPAGTYELEFDGSGFASGIYFYSIKAGEYSETKKMILIK